MRHKPTLPYSGLTIVLSNQSRFDKFELISGTAGHYFQEECLPISRNSCDVRTAATIVEGLLPDTKAILLLGEVAFQMWTDGVYKDYSLSEQRGNPLKNKWNLDCIASYFPQDCMDVVDYETKFNPQTGEKIESENEEDGDEYDTKKKGKTKRSNYRFWLKQDTRKINKRIRQRHLFDRSNSTCLDIKLAPASSEIERYLSGLKDENLYLDIETTVDGGYNLLCIGISTDTSPIYVIPFFRFNRVLHYAETFKILEWLTLAMLRNTVITWNGFGFDLIILAWRYHLLWGRSHYDGMIAHHRCFPEVEKSLGHGISLWLWEEYHKDEGCFSPHSAADDMRLWNYNALDVHRMRQIKWEIDKYAKTIPGLEDSIRQGNDCIYPYTLASLSGINYDDGIRSNIISENDRLMMQYLSLIDIAKGDGYKERLLPTSSQSCVKFFHDYMNYEVVSRSKRISKATGKPLNTPSLDEKAMFKLKLKYPMNPLIDICIAYRRKKKESSMLMFQEWRINDLPS